MVAPSIGQVVLVLFPFSNLAQAKVRPALVVADAGRDWVLGQITSNPYGDPAALQLENADLTTGGLQAASWARPGKLFTALLIRVMGTLNSPSFDKVRDAVLAIIKS